MGDNEKYLMSMSSELVESIRGRRLKPTPDGHFTVPDDIKDKYARCETAPAPANHAPVKLVKVEGFKEEDFEKRRQKLKQRERKKRQSKAAYLTVQSIMLAIMLVAMGKLGENLKSNVEGSEHRQDIGNLVSGVSQAPQATPDRTAPAYPLPTPQRIEYPETGLPSLAQLQQLEEINSDFQFWMVIPDSNVNYYVVQAADNDFYLHRNIYKQYLYSGSVFLDFRCDGSTMDGHTIVYGHTMNDLSIFGELRDYMNESYYNSHRYIYTCSTEGITMWRVYSVYITTTDEYYIETYFRDDEEYLEFINGLRGKSMHPVDTVLTAEDDVMTLSTCYRPNGGASGRLTVHAVKVGTGPIS